MSDELKPCPFCGGTNLEVKVKGLTSIVCKRCYACGPCATTSAGAARAWNIDAADLVKRLSKDDVALVLKLYVANAETREEPT